MKHILILNSLFILTIIYPHKSKAQQLWVSYDQQVHQALHRYIPFKLKPEIKKDHLYYQRISTSHLKELRLMIKQQLHRHGGYVLHSKFPIQYKSLKSWRNNLFNYTVKRQKLVTQYISQLQEENISQDIIHLSSYPTRYHTSKTGLEAMQWIYKKWGKLCALRTDCTINYYHHQKTPQPSVILTIRGSSSHHIILGGHADSINTNDEGNESLAPGADDNAAGIAVLTEILRVITTSSFKPQRTIQFIAYAAEEVGIIGSYEIAANYAKNNILVDGVIQFDGVNFTGQSYDMALIGDYTSQKQNQFLAMLIDTYLKVSWRYEQCGYGCSDHAAWNYEGYHASFPVETTADEQNPYIHSPDDTFDKSNNNSNHAMIFAKLGIAYLLELDSQ